MSEVATKSADQVTILAALNQAIADAMEACVERGCRQEGILPGGLKVPRRAAAIFRRLQAGSRTETDPLVIKKRGRWILFGHSGDKLTSIDAEHGRSPIDTMPFTYDGITIMPFSNMAWIGQPEQKMAKVFIDVSAMRQIVRVDPDAVPADQTRHEVEKVPFRACSRQHLLCVEAQLVEDDREFIHQGNVQITLGVFDYLGRLRNLD